MQNICTDGNGEKMPMKNESISVTEVIVMDTAASDNMMAIRSGTGSFGEARLHAANITNVSSIPIPGILQYKLMNSFRKHVGSGYNNVVETIGGTMWCKLTKGGKRD